MPSRLAIKLGNAGVAIWICHGLTCLPVQNMIIRIEVPDQWKLRHQKPWQAFVLRNEPDLDAGKQNGSGHGRRELGRAEISDSVGPYVSIPVVAVSLNK